MKYINWFKNNYTLLIILSFGAFLRIYHADFQSLWLDEILTMNDANPNLTFKEFYDGIMFWEFIPHFYFFILHYFFEIFGYSTLVARIFSAIIGVFGIFSMYLFGKELFNKKSGLIAASLLCVNYFHIFYSQEIRPYGLFLLFTILSFYRLSIFLKKSTLKNAVLYGFFTGLILNCHFFGFITLFCQYLILLFFLIQSPKEKRKSFFINSFISGITTLLVFLPAYEAFIRASGISSFWLTKPSTDAFNLMLKEFFGNSEMVLFVINFIVLFYVLNLFKTKIENYKYDTIINQKTIFSFILLFTWLFISLILPLIRSYLSVPMILSRYFINIVPALIIVLTIGIEFIKSKLIKTTVIACFLTLSLIDLFVVKNYYNTPTKTQFRELSNEITKRNLNNTDLISFWTWLFPYYFQNDPKIKVSPNSQSLEEYVTKLKTGAIPQKSFWYADANSRPFNLKPEDIAYLEENYILKEKLEYLDAWANYYESKTEPLKNKQNDFSLNSFNIGKLNDNGALYLFENSNLKTEFMTLKKGSYNLILNANSLPEKPINNENAHFIIKINGEEIANFNLSENVKNQKKIIPFSYSKDEQVRFQLTYDNDVFENGMDRNAVIYSIDLKKL